MMEISSAIASENNKRAASRKYFPDVQKALLLRRQSLHEYIYAMLIAAIKYDIKIAVVLSFVYIYACYYLIYTKVNCKCLFK